MSDHEVVGHLAEDRSRAEERLTDHIGCHRGEDEGVDGIDCELTKDELEPEEEPGYGSVEGGRDAAGGPARDKDA